MRVSPVALLYRERSLEEALTFSDRVTQITHDHSEGRKGARAVTEAIWLALQRMGAGVVRRKIARRYGYDRERSVDATFASTRSQGQIAKIGAISASYCVDCTDESYIASCRVRG